MQTEAGHRKKEKRLIQTETLTCQDILSGKEAQKLTRQNFV